MRTRFTLAALGLLILPLQSLAQPESLIEAAKKAYQEGRDADVLAATLPFREPRLLTFYQRQDRYWLDLPV